MKITQKTVISIAVVIAVLGLVLVGTAITMVGGDFTLLGNTKPLEEKTQELNIDALSSLNLNIDNANIVLVPSLDNQIHVTYFENETEVYQFTKNKNELVITQERATHWWNYIGFNFNFPKSFTIAIPESSLINISLKTSNGNVSVNDVSLTGSMIATTSNGKIAVSNSTFTGMFNLTSSNGEIKLEDVAAKELSLQTNNGKIRLTKVSSEENLSARSSNSGIYIERIFAGKGIKLETSNGKISGSIDDAIRNFSITSHTSNGTNNLPSDLPGGSKELYAKTSNGKIDIKFEQ